MSLRSRAVSCTQCGAPVQIRNALKAKTATCSGCGSQLDLARPGLEILGRVDRYGNEPDGWIALGLRCTVEGLHWEVIGRIRYQGSDGSETWHWDEWLLLSERGTYAWIGESEGACSWLVPTPADEELARIPDAPSAGGATIRGEWYRFVEADRGKIVFLEGELTWRARVGDTVAYVDLANGAKLAASEKSETELELFLGRELHTEELWTAFGHEEALQIKEDWLERRAELERSRHDAFMPVVLLLSSALLMGVLYLGGLMLESPIGASGPELQVGTEQLAHGVDLGALPLEPATTGSYRLSFTAEMGAVDDLTLTIVTPTKRFYPVLLLKRAGDDPGRIEQFTSFRVSEAGEHRLLLTGAGSTGARATIGWELVRRPIAEQWLLYGAGLLVFGGCLAALVALLRGKSVGDSAAIRLRLEQARLRVQESARGASVQVEEAV